MDELVAREYLRVSHDRSGRERSNDEQHDDNERDAANRWTLGEPYRDVGSASRYAKKARGDFDQLIADLAAADPNGRHGCRFDADLLVIWESSRGSRKVGEWVDLLDLCEQRGVHISVTTHNRVYDPANPRDRRTLLEDAVDSEYESGKTSRRVLRTTASTAAARRPHGRRLYGYERVYDSKSGTLLGQRPHPSEARVVRRIFDMYLAGHGIRSIHLALRADGLRRPKGEWTERRVAEVLDNPSYVGRRMWKGEDMGQADPEVWPPLVTAEVFDATRERRRRVKDRMAGGRRSGQGPQLRMLSGVARCGRCTGRMRAQSEQGRPVYQCKTCNRVTRDLQRLDDYVSLWLLGRFADQLANPDKRSEETPDPRVETARARADELKAELEVARLHWKGKLLPKLSTQSFAERESELLPQIAEAEREARRGPIPLSIELPEDPRRLQEWWYEDLTGEQRREVVMAYIAMVVVHPVGRGRRNFPQADYTEIERRR